jgi:hypothetical protein
MNWSSPLSAEHPYLLSFHNPFHGVWFLRQCRRGPGEDDLTRYWRCPSGISLAGQTATDVVRQEQAAGNDLGIGAYLLAELERLSARRLLWVCPRYSDALRYGDAPQAVDVAGRAIAEDGDGGLLLLLDRDFGSLW